MTFDLMTSDYRIEEGKPYVYLRARAFDRTRIEYKVTKDPYFYAIDPNGQYELLDGQKAKKIFVRIPRDVTTEKVKYPRTDEADIRFELRVLIDKGIRCGFTVENGEALPAPFIGVPPRVLYTDIENYAPYGVPDDLSQNPIFCICTIDSYTGEKKTFKVTSRDMEREILLQYAKYVDEIDPDFFAGFNISYDMCGIIDRLNVNGIKPGVLSPLGYADIKHGPMGRKANIKGRESFDILKAYRRLFQGTKLDAYDLESLVKKDLHIDTGEDFTPKYPLVTYENMDEMGIVQLCENHVLWEQMIDNYWKLLYQFDNLRRVIGCKLEQAITTTQYADVLMLRLFKNRYVLPNKPHDIKVDYDFEGAYVMKPTPRLFSNVIHLDFSKMYPGIMIGWNISVETLTKIKDLSLVNEIDGVYFLKEPKGIVPQALEELIVERSKIKKVMESMSPSNPDWNVQWAMQYSYKQIIDACYGVFAHKRFRLYNPLVSKSTTFIGRQLLKSVIEELKKIGHETIYADTDSMFVEVKGDVIKVGEELTSIVNEKLEQFRQLHNLKYPIAVAFEAAYKTMLFTDKKKKYAGLLVYKDGKILEAPELKVKGFEVRRSDASVVTREVQKKILKLMLEDYDIMDIKEAYFSGIESLPTRPLTQSGIPKTLGTEPWDYKAPTQIPYIFHANKHLGYNFRKGDRVLRFCVKSFPPNISAFVDIETPKGKKHRQVKEICIRPGDRIPEGIEIDWPRQGEKILKKKISKLLTSYGTDWEEIFTDKKQHSLTDWGIGG